MEHILQFGITIDEQKIIDRAVEKAADQIVRDVDKQVRQYKDQYLYGGSRLENLFKEEIKAVVEANKESIIADVKKNLVLGLLRSKKVAEMINELSNEVKKESDNE